VTEEERKHFSRDAFRRSFLDAIGDQNRSLRSDLVVESERPALAEAVRKPREFLQTIAQSEIFRDFFASKLSEGSKK
jgi:hypothetical protein